MAKKTVVGIDIGGTKIACGLVIMEDGEAPVVVSMKKIPTNPKRGGKAVLADVVEQAKLAIERSEDMPIGVGISSAGVIDVRTGDVTFANDIMPGWMGTKLGHEVAEATGLPVRVLNDVHAHALGEARWGAGREHASSLVVAVGTGIGSAFVADGTIMLGAHGVAGHVGHVQTPEATGVPCSCGATGHVEPIAAGPGIVEEYVRLSGRSELEDGTPITGAEIDQFANAGDEAAIAAEGRSARALGGVLGSLCNVLDPSCIILSGSVAQCGQHWHGPLHEAFIGQCMAPCKETPIVEGSLGGDAPLIGAAENLVDPGYAELR